ncbi:DUF2974 domain-containing protein [bacterium]|nr:DUF2974 domain-containing protein [bacterium]
MTAYSQIKKHEEYKQLCIASYKPYQKTVPDGYKLWDTIDDKNGFFACIYQKGDEMIIVYRGTQIFDKEDIRNDKQMLNHILPEQSKNALQVYDMVNNFCKENNMKLIVLGHSLGGSLAQIVSAFRNVAAVTFNPFGVKDMLPKDLPYYNENNIINYCNENDYITKMRASNILGKCYKVKSINIWQPTYHFLENMGSLFEREETYGWYLQQQYEKGERSKKEFQEYKKYGRKFINMPGVYSEDNKTGCLGSYAVSGYTREDGTKVDSYIRTCFKHGN